MRAALTMLVAVLALAPAGVLAQVETLPPEAKGQVPAFPGQTRAPAVKSKTPYRVQTIASGLRFPWSVAFLPDGRFLVSERDGRMRVIAADGKLSPPLGGLPPIRVAGQGGLLDIELSPRFAQDRMVYFSYFAPAGGGQAGLAVARGKLSADDTRLDGVQPIFRATPTASGDLNIGGRMLFDRTGALIVSVGDRFELKDKAQTLDNDLGKLVRINPDGSIPKDNPFIGRAGARPEIWTYGNRNSEGLALDASGRVWEVEHGARGGDEINLPEPGKNYGWPVIAYGIDYSGARIGAGITAQQGMEQPIYYWDPVIAPSGLTFYTGKLFPEWQGNLFVGGLRGQQVARLVIRGDRVVGEERLLIELGARIRDVRQGPDGALYVTTDQGDGKLLKLTPR
jgi:glucose/arabinose dehydrogenase